jgi:hypothetical protein
MFARPAALLAVLCLPAAALAQGFEYASGTSQYRITSKTHGSQEAMGQKNEFDTSNNQLLTVTVAKQSKDTLGLTITIDSLSAVGPMGMTPPGIDKLVGIRIAAKMAPYGAVYSSIGPKDDSIPQGSQVTDEMSRFLPRIRAKLAPGATWTDTTTGKLSQGGVDVDRRTIAKFTVVGDTTVGGQKAWKLARETTTNLSGSGTSQGQPMTMEGLSTGKATLLLSQAGVFLGGLNEDQANIKIVLAANGMEIGVNTTANTTVEKVK